MALTYTVAFNEVPGAEKLVAGTVTFDASYTTGGLAVAASSLAPGASQVLWMITGAGRGVAGTSGISTRFDATNQKLLVFNTTAGAETAAATNLSALVFDYVALVR